MSAPAVSKRHPWFRAGTETVNFGLYAHAKAKATDRESNQSNPLMGDWKNLSRVVYNCSFSKIFQSIRHSHSSCQYCETPDSDRWRTCGIGLLSQQMSQHDGLGEGPLNGPMVDLTSTTTRRLGSSPGLTVTIDTLTVVLVTSAAFYLMCFRLARLKLTVLNNLQPQMTTKKLLILSVLLVSVLRIMTILGVAAMNMANVRAHYSLQPSRHSGDRTQAFYDEAMTVLFDIPNAITVSTYVLLTLVWAECFLEARFHTENSVHWKRRLLIMFMIFNTLLYATQLILYACIFFSGSNSVVRTILYAAITGINFTAVVMVLCFYVYLSCRFAGFPYRSEEQKASLSRVSSVMTL